MLLIPATLTLLAIGFLVIVSVQPVSFQTQRAVTALSAIMMGIALYADNQEDERREMQRHKKEADALVERLERQSELDKQDQRLAHMRYRNLQRVRGIQSRLQRQELALDAANEDRNAVADDLEEAQARIEALEAAAAETPETPEEPAA